jgi:hypothetical protein
MLSIYVYWTSAATLLNISKVRKPQLAFWRWGFKNQARVEVTE